MAPQTLKHPKTQAACEWTDECKRKKINKFRKISSKGVANY